MNRDIIVVGASAGGVEALKKLVEGFPSDLPASVFVTQHLPSGSEPVLPAILRANGPLPAIHPQDAEAIQRAHIYVAPPDYHLVFEDNHVHLSHGPRENMQRPCINTMFRSAAGVFGARVIGIVLSGLLDDGAAGLWEIQRKGGLAVVQDPSDAAFKSMPESAIRGLDVNHILPVAEMKFLWRDLAQEPQKGGDMTLREVDHVERSTQSCPECGGVMERATIGRMHEYRCHTGHRFGTKTMVAEKTSTQERAIAAALAQTEELIVLLEEAKSDTPPSAFADIEAEIAARQREAQTLSQLLVRQIESEK